MGRRGFSLTEMVVVLILAGIFLAMTAPHLKTTPESKARSAAMKLAGDLEHARTRALAARSAVRVTFDAAAGRYAMYLDVNRDGVFALTQAEADAVRSVGVQPLAGGIKFGRGTAPDVPDYAGAGAITFAGSRVDFDSRGLTTPLGTRGVVYLSDATGKAVSAVSLSGGGGVRVWTYRMGVWQ